MLRSARVPLAFTALIGVGALMPCSPLRDAVRLGSAAGSHLWLPPACVALAPVLETLDALASLSAAEHVALVGGAFLLFGAWRWRRQRVARGPWRRVATEIGALAVFVVGVLATYAALTLLHRPMAALRVTDPDVAVV